MDRSYVTHKISFMVVALTLVVLSLLLIRPYFTAVMVSLISVIVLKPLFDWVLRRRWVKERRNLAAGITVAIFILAVVIPVALVAWILIGQLASALVWLSEISPEEALKSLLMALEGPSCRQAVQTAGALVEGVRTVLGALGAALVTFAASVVTSLPGVFVQGLIFIMLVGSLLPRFDQIAADRPAISPLGPELSILYNRKITAMVRSLVSGVFLISVIQGAAMGLFYWLAGLPYVFLLSVVSMFLALVPMVGISWLVIAIAIVGFLSGNAQMAIIVLIGFYGVVNWIDFFLRPRLISEEARIPMALFILAIFGGLAWAGLMGLFYGPIIMLLLITTVQIYADRYASEDGKVIHVAYTRLADTAVARRDQYVAAGGVDAGMMAQSQNPEAHK
jgi:predicted PurR-regulated permease PerM